jgi:IMP dehydrogenase
MKLALSFDDVLLVPGKNQLESRDMVSITTELALGLTLDLPIIAANMPTICGHSMASSMSMAGGMGVIHRMQPIESQAEMVAQAMAVLVMGSAVGAAVGVGEDYLERARACVEAGARVICIDVAHGHSEQVKLVLKSLLTCFPDVHIIVGNIATAHAAEYLMRGHSVDNCRRIILKVGIGGGSVCTTRVQTGCGVPTFQSVLDIASQGYRVIADGGIRNSGDIVKCLAAGARAVMVGGLLAGTKETPGGLQLDNDGNTAKRYCGSASSYSKKAFFGSSEYIEGAEMLVPARGPVSEVLTKLAEGIRSGVTYVGATNLQDLSNYAEFIQVTSQGAAESHPHGLGRPKLP